MSQNLRFQWHNHMSVMNEFKKFLSYGLMVDVTLACDGKSLKAHKMVLSACSSFFRSLFLENPCKHPIVILKDVKYAELKAIIDFMYSGEVYVPENQVYSLIKTAQNLKVKGIGEVESQDDHSDYQPKNLSDDEFEDHVNSTSENESNHGFVNDSNNNTSENESNHGFVNDFNNNTSENQSSDEFVNDSNNNISENQSNDESLNESIHISDVQYETFSQGQMLIDQNESSDSPVQPELMESVQIKPEVLDYDMTQNDSNSSVDGISITRVTPSAIRCSLLQQSSIQNEHSQDSTTNFKAQAFTASDVDPRTGKPSVLPNQSNVPNRPRFSSVDDLGPLPFSDQSLPSFTKMDKMLEQNHISKNLVVRIPKLVPPPDAIVADTQQPSTSSNDVNVIPNSAQTAPESHPVGGSSKQSSLSVIVSPQSKEDPKILHPVAVRPSPETQAASHASTTEKEQSASGKRPLKKSVEESVQKRRMSKEIPSEKPVREPHNLRQPEVAIISDSNSVKKPGRPKRSRSNPSVKDSESNNSGIKIYVCKLCPFRTVGLKCLKGHITSKHRENRVLKCNKCSFFTYAKDKLKHHAKLHWEYSCSFCTNKFNNKSHLTLHLKSFHNIFPCQKLDELAFKCVKCEFSASEEATLKKHVIEVHEKNVPSIVINRLPEHPK